MPVSELFFFLGFAVGCALALARHPVYGLVTYIATVYMDPAAQWWGHGWLLSVRWELIPAAITLIAMLIHRRSTPSPVFRSGMFWGFVAFVIWIIIQSAWAIDAATHAELLSIWAKFLLVSIMVCGCVDSWKNLRLILWTHALGCTYMGWLAHGLYHGGRFQGFGFVSNGDANEAALILVTGFVTAAVLFLNGNWKTKVALVLPLAFIADGIATTESRSGFLAALAAGIVFNWFTPKRLKGRVFAASALGILGFLALTTSAFWNRMDTIKYGGANVSGVDTGHSRIVIIEAQWKMFREHPFGCGSGCTEALSPQYIPPQYLAKGLGRRASHNTMMTMLVDHGIPGAILYLAMLAWLFTTIRKLGWEARRRDGFPALVLPGLAAVMVAITVAEQFGQYPRLEVRIWFISLIIAYSQLLRQAYASDVSPALEARPSLEAQVNTG